MNFRANFGSRQREDSPVADPSVLSLLLMTAPAWEPGRSAAMARRKSKAGFRIEHDLLGEKKIPADAYYGVQTLRALENFKISGVPISHYPDLIRALAMVKLAAAKANVDCKQIPRKILPAIEKACREIMDGKLHEEFQVDVYQGGAGTSVNMNANEVLANRALEHLGKRKGDYEHCDPHDHLNASQSTNDAYPSALHLGMALMNTRLIAEMKALVEAFRRKAREFRDVVKMGRTQLQDAVPMTLGQEFKAYARTLSDELQALESVQRVLYEVNMGATAIGTGLNAPTGYDEKCVDHLAKISGFPKVGNDLRLLSSGPRCGLYEINLPAKQPGSSIMPGKVNPVIPEVTNMVSYRVIGNDFVVRWPPKPVSFSSTRSSR
jgi:aspartate ammonia-lyase